MILKEESAKVNSLTEEEKTYMIRYFLIALLLRGIMVSLIYIFEDSLGSHLYIDDWKYETYAKSYYEIAKCFIDMNAFNTIDKQMGVAVAQLYFRFNALLYYITNSVLFLRLANVLFASLTVFPVFLIARELFGKKEAKIASLIFTILPYHIIMSAFVFKDILIVLMMASSLYMILRFYKYGKINIPLFLILTLPIQWLRPGMPVFLFGVLAFAIFVKFFNRSDTNKILIILLGAILAIVMIRFIFIDRLEQINSRFDIYMRHGREHSGNINIIRIDSLSQMYKLPLTWVFSTFFPISFRGNISSWAGVLGVLNYTSIFIAPGYILYTIFYRKNSIQRVFFYPMLALHLLVIIAVINIPRHYYFLHFYMIICSSAYLARLKDKKALRYMIMTVTMYIGLLYVALWIIV